MLINEDPVKCVPIFKSGLHIAVMFYRQKSKINHRLSSAAFQKLKRLHVRNDPFIHRDIKSIP